MRLLLAAALAAAALAAVVISVVPAAAAPPVPDYTGWQIIVNGLQITTATFHSHLAFPIDDRVTIVRRGGSRYLVVKNDYGKGLDRYSTKLVSSSTHLTVNGQGKASFPTATPPVTKRWTYQLGPSSYPPDFESFSLRSGGKARTSPDEPMFMPWMIDVNSYLPESEWGVAPDDNGSLAQAKQVALWAWDAASAGEPSPLEFAFPHRLDAQHLTASGHRSFTFNLKDLRPIDEESGLGTVEVTYSVVVIPAKGSKPPVECIIEPPDDYTRWRPEGGADEKTSGNTLEVRAHLQLQGQPGKAPEQGARFQFLLTGVSHEPGVALNQPLKEPQSTPDLGFVEGGAAVPKEEGRQAETAAADLLEASAQVACYDYGAYGAVRVIALLEGGGVVFGHLAGHPEQEELSLPLDANGNHLADCWEEQEGVSGKPADWDQETTPQLGDRAGDGLSLYQEYRGLVHAGRRVPLKGNVLDLVVENDAGEGIRPGLALFAKATGINIVELGKDELPQDRRVNQNAGTGDSGVAQCGLRLTSEALARGTIGMAWPDKVKASPKDCERVAFNSDLSFMTAADRAAMLPMAVAHELGHALGAQHHGDSARPLENYTLNAAGNNEVIGLDGTPITTRPYTLTGLTETKLSGGESSGAQDCVMRNSSFFQWVCHVDKQGVAHYYAVPPKPPGTTFCTSPAGTGINAEGNRPASYFGNAQEGRGACLHHLRVTDRP